MREAEADVVVFKWRRPVPPARGILAVIREVARLQELPAITVQIDVGLDEADLYAYLRLRRATIAPAVALARALERVGGVGGARAARLAQLQEIRGASAGAAVAFHYVVETDVAAEAEGDMNDWYNQEHLLGLAAVPGTVRAQRFLNLDGAPRYHSCYELVDRDTLRSAPWLAVRNTAWSGRIRRAFQNTKRTMFRRIAEQPV